MSIESSKEAARAAPAAAPASCPIRTTCVGPRTAGAGLVGIDLADHQPIEQPADGGQMLLDRGGAIHALHLVDVGGHGDRGNPVRYASPCASHQVKNRVTASAVGRACMRVAAGRQQIQVIHTLFEVAA